MHQISCYAPKAARLGEPQNDTCARIRKGRLSHVLPGLVFDDIAILGLAAGP